MTDRTTRIIFMGTPEFAVPSLKILLEAGYPIAGVITAPDKPGGRGMKETMVSPVKKFALEHDLHVLQPVNLKAHAFLEELRELDADLQVVVAFRMLPKIVWDMPRLGTINLHGSLLPAYRGAAPIQWAIIRGESVTGLTTFKLQHEIDAGQIIYQLEIPILPDDTAGTLHDRMSIAGAGLVLGTADLISSGLAVFHQQDEWKVSHAPKIHHEDGRINWNESVSDIYNLIRGMSPWPGAWTMLDGKELKILKAAKFSENVMLSPGSLRVEGKKMIAQARDGEIELLEIQMTGKRRMLAGEFLNGYKITDLSLT